MYPGMLSDGWLAYKRYMLNTKPLSGSATPFHGRFEKMAKKKKGKPKKKRPY